MHRTALRASAFLLAAGLFLPGIHSPARAVPIGDLHCNDSQGRPRAPYNVGTAVAISGIVTAGTSTFAPTRTEIFVQDATGGIMVFKSTATTTYLIGDSCTFNGTIDHYRGMTEVVLGTYTVHSHGHQVPEPRTVTCSQVANQFGPPPNYCEPEEGMLIRLHGVTYTGTWANNQVVTLHDATGTCDMYIDTDTGVGSIPPPEGRFDLIGCLKQFSGFSPPFNTGYEVLPRMPADVIPLPGPGFTRDPEEFDITPTSVRITWQTDFPSDSKIEYGYSDYTVGTVYDPAMVTEHSVTLTGLEPAKIHLYRVTSTNEDGETAVGGLRFCSGSRSSGDIQVYFNKSVETNLALGTPAQGNTDFIPPLVNRINAAQHSIDVAIYSFDMAGPADALIAAHQRGVAIRFVTDNRDNLQDQVIRISQAGIQVILDDFGPNNAGSGLMHDKFWVFDHRLDSDPANDYVLTGSWNVTYEGTYTDAQNLMVIQDESVAEIYTAEIDEMWGSTSNTPNGNTSRFGLNKLDDTPKKVVIDGRPARIYFGPSDNTMPRLSETILNSESSAHFSILTFTRIDVANALLDRFENVPGYPVRGVFDSAETGNASSQYKNLKGIGDYPWNPPADVWLDTEPGSLHHKYIILDVNKHGLQPTVNTGSSNWSNAANNENDENILIIEDFGIANQYYQEFAARYHAAGGSADLTVDVPDGIAADPTRVNVSPNPAMGRLVIVVRPAQAGVIEVVMTDISGRWIGANEIEAGAPGSEARMEWDCTGLTAGFYFLRIAGAGLDEQRRLTVLK